MGDLRTAFDETVTANAEVVAGIDAAVIASGRAVADQIDYAIDNLSGEALTKALYLMPHLMGILKEMLATPASRKAVGLAGKAGGATSKLGNLQAQAAKRRRTA